jgi:hypothetical protein
VIGTFRLGPRRQIAAVQQLRGFATQPLDERGRGVQGEADEVNDDVGMEADNTVREGALAVLDGSIRGDVTYLLPRWGRRRSWIAARG